MSKLLVRIRPLPPTLAAPLLQASRSSTTRSQPVRSFTSGARSENLIPVTYKFLESESWATRKFSPPTSSSLGLPCVEAKISTRSSLAARLGNQVPPIASLILSLVAFSFVSTSTWSLAKCPFSTRNLPKSIASLEA